MSERNQSSWHYGGDGMTSTSVIWKFPLEVIGSQLIEVPAGSVILSVGNQRGTVCMWVVVDPSVEERESRCIEIHGTGHSFNNSSVPDGKSRKFLGTVIVDPFVWHLFEITRR